VIAQKVYDLIRPLFTIEDLIAISERADTGGGSKDMIDWFTEFKIPWMCISAHEVRKTTGIDISYAEFNKIIDTLRYGQFMGNLPIVWEEKTYHRITLKSTLLGDVVAHDYGKWTAGRKDVRSKMPEEAFAKRRIFFHLCTIAGAVFMSNLAKKKREFIKLDSGFFKLAPKAQKIYYFFLSHEKRGEVRITYQEMCELQGWGPTKDQKLIQYRLNQSKLSPAASRGALRAQLQIKLRRPLL
jgi:hypothetical protein